MENREAVRSVRFNWPRTMRYFFTDMSSRYIISEKSTLYRVILSLEQFYEKIPFITIVDRCHVVARVRERESGSVA